MMTKAQKHYERELARVAEFSKRIAARDCQLERELLDAYRQLKYLWDQTGSCPCGARRESLDTHSHVTGCPTAKAIERDNP